MIALPPLLALLLLAPPQSLGSTETSPLPAGTLAAPLLADPRETSSSLTLRTGTPAIETTLATDIGIVRFTADRVALQLDLSAGFFVDFEPEGELTFAGTTFDGLFRFPVSVSIQRVSVRLEWAHISGHYLDGARILDDYGDLNTETYSREYLRLLIMWEGSAFSPYAGWRELLHSLPQVPGPAFQLGYNLVDPAEYPVYHALDVKQAAEYDWSPSVTVQAGLHLRGNHYRAVRLGLLLRTGPDDTGKLMGQADTYLGLVLGFDKTRGDDGTARPGTMLLDEAGNDVPPKPASPASPDNGPTSTPGPPSESQP